jgi:DNA (cytosine-5)-methyltransferase 1
MFIHEDSLEYNVHWTVLNSKDFGVPQNRERVFIVGIRKDLPNTFRFPVGWALPIRLKHILEPVVDEKYYLSDKMIAGFLAHTKRHSDAGNGFKFEPKSGDDIANCVKANCYKMTPDDNYVSDILIKIGSIYPDDNDAGRIYSTEGISTTIKSEGGGMGAKTGLYVVAQLGRPDESGKNVQQLEFRDDELTNTLTSVHKDNMVFDGCRIRRLTPLECARLQGFPDDFKKPVSDSQLYKQFGNTITNTVLIEICKNLLNIK